MANSDKVIDLHDRWSLSQMMDYEFRLSSERNIASIKKLDELSRQLKELVERDFRR